MKKGLLFSLSAILLTTILLTFSIAINTNSKTNSNEKILIENEKQSYNHYAITQSLSNLYRQIDVGIKQNENETTVTTVLPHRFDETKNLIHSYVTHALNTHPEIRIILPQNIRINMGHANMTLVSPTRDTYHIADDLEKIWVDGFTPQNTSVCEKIISDGKIRFKMEFSTINTICKFNEYIDATKKSEFFVGDGLHLILEKNQLTLSCQTKCRYQITFTGGEKMPPQIDGLIITESTNLKKTTNINY